MHFRTHGFANHKNPELSGIVMSMVDDKGNLVNGFLRLTDIFNSKQAENLVVLSACQSGIRQNIKSEGRVGLTRGFMYAGAQRVAVSLWNVDDEGTAVLIDLLQKSFSSIDGTGSSAHPTRVIFSCGMGILPVLFIFARGLMQKLYQKMLQQKLAQAAALRAAQIEMMQQEKRRSPYFWAAFTLQGE